MKEYTLKDRKIGIVSKIVIITIWILLSKLINNQVIFPSIKNTILSLWAIINGPSFIYILGYSLLRSLVGFIISLLFAIILGIASSFFKLANCVMEPIISFLSTVPIIAIIILALIWFSNEFTPVFIGFIMVFPILYESVLKGILNIDRNIIQMAKIYKVDRITIIKDIYIPSIFINLRLILSSAIGINLKMVIAGEVLSQPRFAIGTNLYLEKMYLNTAGVFAWIIIIIFVSKTFEFMWKGIAYYVWDKRCN